MRNVSESELWSRIKAALDAGSPTWKARIQSFGQVQAIERRASGGHWTDDDVQEALVKAVLSNNTDWSKIEGVLSHLSKLFRDYSLRFYASLNEGDIDKDFVPWFGQRKAGSMSLGKDLKTLIKTSRILQDWSDKHGSAEDYFLKLFRRSKNDPKKVAFDLGLPKSEFKLPALGVPIAAEALKNMGFDVAKPDRHILRAAGSFGLVSFRKWEDQSANRPPKADKSEVLYTMTAIETFARGQNEQVTYVDNAIWIMCARSGLGWSNDKLKQLAGMKRP